MSFSVRDGRLIRTPGTFTLLRAPRLSVVERFAQQIVVLFFSHDKFEFSVIDKYVAAYGKALRKTGITHPDISVAGQCSFFSRDANDVARRKQNV